MEVYQPRLVDSLITRLLGELPALFIVGPRAAGKTTTASRFARTIVRLDREAEAVAFRADPDAALRGLDEPVLLDEWQAVPGVLGAVKRSLDKDSRPGRYLITGSVRADLEGEVWPGTGRLTRLALYGMTVRELLGWQGRPFLDRAVEGENLVGDATRPDLRGYLDLLLRSGFPEAALRLTEAARARWLDSYVEQLLTRDAELVDGGRDPARLRRYLEALALSTAGVVEDVTLFEAAGIARKTAFAYERLLMNLLVVEALPAWTSNRLKRLVLRPKRVLVDAAVAAAVVRADAAAILRDGDLLGRLLETFVVSQLRAELAVTSVRPVLHHVRQQQGRFEVDVVADLGARGLVGLEVKATASPGSTDARHLVRLRDVLGDRFVRGVVLHTGPATIELGDRIVAAPISSLWAGRDEG